MSDRMFSELDQIFQNILDGVSPAGRTRTARKIGLALRRSQQRRIASQKNPDGSGYAVRRRKVYRTQQGIKFFWNNEVRALKTGAVGAVNMAGQSRVLTRSAGISAPSTVPISSGIWKSKRNQRRIQRQKKHRCLPACAPCVL